MKKIVILLVSLCAGFSAQGMVYDPTAEESNYCQENHGHYSYSIHLGLKYNEAGLLKMAQAVSQPGSSEYGHYLNSSAVADAFGGSQEAANKVAGFFQDYQGSNIRIHPSRLGVTGEVSAQIAASQFCVDLDSPYTSDFCIPAALKDFVERIAVSPFCFGLHEQQEQPDTLADNKEEGACPAAQNLVSQKVFLPEQMAQATGLSKFYQDGFQGKGGRLAILLSMVSPDRQSVDTYKKCFAINTPYQVHSGTPYDFPALGAVEPQLDVEIALSAAPDLDELTFFSTGFSIGGADIAWLLTQALDEGNYQKGLPQVVSISQGANEKVLSHYELDLVDVYLQLAAVMGVTVVAASGDQGYLNSYYTGRKLGAVFPATSPWVTSVGGTTVALGDQNQIATEVVWNQPSEQAASGGGPSGVYTRPIWQVGKSDTGVWEGKKRLTPDIAFIGDISYMMVQAQNWMPVGGTSASTPYMAASLVLLNTYLEAKGKPAVGFINPLLYNISNMPPYPSIFYDVVNGTSNGNGSVSPAVGGATVGYDRATGLGSIRFDSLADYLLSKPLPQVKQGVRAK